MTLCKCADGSFVVQAARVGVRGGRKAYLLRLRSGNMVAPLPFTFRPRARQRGRPGRAEALLAAALVMSALIDALSTAAPVRAAGYGVAAAALIGGLLGYVHLRGLTGQICEENGIMGWACSVNEVSWTRASSFEGPYRRRQGLTEVFVYRVGVGDATYELRLRERELRELEEAGALPG